MSNLNWFYVSFRLDCRSLCACCTYESLAFYSRECREVLSFNLSGIDSLVVRKLFEIFLDECNSECLRRIEDLASRSGS